MYEHYINFSSKYDFLDIGLQIKSIDLASINTAMMYRFGPKPDKPGVDLLLLCLDIALA